MAEIYKISTVRPPFHGGVTASLGPTRPFARNYTQRNWPTIHTNIRVGSQHTTELQPHPTTADSPRLPLVSTLELSHSRIWRASRVLTMTTTETCRRTTARNSSHHAGTCTCPHATHSHHGGAAQQPHVADRPARPASPLATQGNQPAQAAPPSVTRSATASASLAPLGLDPCAHNPARAHGDNAGGSGGTGTHAPTPTLMRRTTSDAPSPLGPFDTHVSTHAPPPSPPMARQRHHTTPPPIAPPRDSAGGSDSADPQAPAPALPRLTASGTPSLLGLLDAHIDGHTHPPTPHMAHQQRQHTPAHPMTSPRAAPASPLTGVDPSSMGGGRPTS